MYSLKLPALQLFGQCSSYFSLQFCGAVESGPAHQTVPGLQRHCALAAPARLLVVRGPHPHPPLPVPPPPPHPVPHVCLGGVPLSEVRDEQHTCEARAPQNRLMSRSRSIEAIVRFF